MRKICACLPVLWDAANRLNVSVTYLRERKGEGNEMGWRESNDDTQGVLI